MNTSHKLWLGFGTLTALLLLSSVAIATRVAAIDSEVRRMADGRNLSANAEELSVSALSYVLGVRSYLQTGDAQVIERAAADAARVEQLIEQHDQLGAAIGSERAASDIRGLWAEIRVLGQALTDPDNRVLRMEHSRRLLDLHLQMEQQNKALQAEALAVYNERKDQALADVRTVQEFAFALVIAGGLIALATSIGVSRGVMQAEQRLIEADHRKNEFLAVLAHELRNPLAPIGNMLNVLRARKLSAIETPLGVMERQLGQMVRLVDDLLDISRISQGKIELRIECVVLAEVIDQAIETVVPLREAMNHHISLSLPQEPICVRADPARLAQIISNLLHNACKFSDAGSEIQLIVTAMEGRATLRVRDQGIGIGPDQIGRVFDPFMQAGSSLGRSGSGIGIGLTLVKNLVELHGGDIAVHSAGLGRGSEFVVRLPLAPKVATDEAAPAQVPDNNSGKDPGKDPGSTDSAGSLRVLVVDDNRDSAESMSVLLELHGHQTRSAGDGIEALAMIEEWQPQVVLLDIGLPGIDGYEVARRLRARPDQATLHLIAVTGWGQDEDRRKSAEAGFDGHLVKPADYAALAGMLADVRSARSPRRDSSRAAANTHG